MEIILPLLIGSIAGWLSGMVGIGGGIIIIPALMYFLKFHQKLAQGTSIMALVPPIGMLAAYEYYKRGFVDIRSALLISTGYIVGGYFGAKLAVKADVIILSRGLGVAMIVVGLKFLLQG